MTKRQSFRARNKGIRVCMWEPRILSCTEQGGPRIPYFFPGCVIVFFLFYFGAPILSSVKLLTQQIIHNPNLFLETGLLSPVSLIIRRYVEFLLVLGSLLDLLQPLDLGPQRASNVRRFDFQHSFSFIFVFFTLFGL